MKFEWDQSKDFSNQKKHGISFNNAISIFWDPHVLSMFDDSHSSAIEDRWASIGMNKSEVIVLVIHTFKSEDKIRIISARKATKKEKKMYYYRRGASL